MAKLTWDQIGERFYETGIDKVVLYLESNGAYPTGEAWSGVTAINENPSGAEPSPLYADNIKYLNLMSTEDFGFGIEAFYYPDSFEGCDGCASMMEGVTLTQQTRKTFGVSYRSKIGSDTKGVDYGYKLHLVYGCTASPSAKNHNTINENPEAPTMSWDVTTIPVEVPGNFKPTAHIIIDSNALGETKLAKLEEALYGGEGDQKVAHLPLPSELATLLA